MARLIKSIRSIFEGKLAGLSRDEKTLVRKIRDSKLTYLSDSKLVGLLRCVHSIEEKDVPGVFIEAGCALGGSSILIAKTKETVREFQIYDVFDMIPAPTEEDTEDVHERYRTIV